MILQKPCLGKIWLYTKMPLTNQLAGFFKLEYLKNYLNYKVYFLHVIRYSRKLLFDYITIAGGGGGGGDQTILELSKVF